MHLPELALRRRRLGRLGGVLGVRMGRREREVAEHEAQLGRPAGLHLLDDRVRRAAVRALVVAVLDQRDRRVGRALDVVALAR